MEHQPESVSSYCLKMLATTACLMLLMLVTAKDPSTDDAIRGGVGGVIGWMLSNLIGRK